MHFALVGRSYSFLVYAGPYSMNMYFFFSVCFASAKKTKIKLCQKHEWRMPKPKIPPMERFLLFFFPLPLPLLLSALPPSLLSFSPFRLPLFKLFVFIYVGFSHRLLRLHRYFSFFIVKYHAQKCAALVHKFRDFASTFSFQMQKKNTAGKRNSLLTSIVTKSL